MDYITRLRNLREDNDKTQKEIAAYLGYSQQGYAHLENRRANFKVEDIIKLCKYYNVSSDYILCLSEERNS